MENTSNNTSLCHDCGSRISADAGFCTFCGAPQAKSPAREMDEPDDSNAPTLAGEPIPDLSAFGAADALPGGNDEIITEIHRPAGGDEIITEIRERSSAGGNEAKAADDYDAEPATLISHPYIPKPSAELPGPPLARDAADFDTARDRREDSDPRDSIDPRESGDVDEAEMPGPLDFGGDINSESDAAKAMIESPAAEAIANEGTEPAPEPAVESAVEPAGDSAGDSMADPNANTLEDVEAIAEKLQEEAAEAAQAAEPAEPVTGEVEESVAELAAALESVQAAPAETPETPEAAEAAEPELNASAPLGESRGDSRRPEPVLGSSSEPSILPSASSAPPVAPPAQVPPPPYFLRDDAAAGAPAPGEKAPENADATYTSQIDQPETTGGRKLTKQAQTLTEGTLLYNRYEIVRKIGGGGMGAVYLASDRNLGGVLRAVKEMVQSHIEAEQQEKALADFKRESLLLTSLEHPCIPTIYDYFFDEAAGRFYLVMKYISGGDLAARLRSAPEGRIDEKSVTEWAAQTADVLDYLHTGGKDRPPIVYRDLKPSNLMIDGSTGRIMLVDFGIARWVTKNEKDVTAVGTMGYAPPELFSGNVEPRSDIYSLGATMFHLLTGADPQSNPLLIFDFTKHPRPRQVNPAVSNEMEQILMRAVEYNVELRYGSAAELREALLTHLERVRYGQLSYHNNAPAHQPHQSASQMPPGGAQAMVFCGFCGEKILGNDVFCPFCGAKQSVGDQRAAASMHFAPPVSRSLARVTVLGTGELAPPTFNLEKPTNIVGRRDPQTNIFPEVDLSKYDPQTKISRRHARIWKEGETFLVEDLGSSNGTVIVSNMNVALKLPPHQPHILLPNSKLVVGDTTLHFVVG